MARSPPFKVFNPSGEYIGCTKYAEDAAALVGLQGPGAKVKHGHRKVIWDEGLETVLAADSYDGAAEIMHKRIEGEQP